ncbi:MAG: hypothetical protein ACRESK_03710, partial [Gammaproteobacteria bacterium]
MLLGTNPIGFIKLQIEIRRKAVAIVSVYNLAGPIFFIQRSSARQDEARSARFRKNHASIVLRCTCSAPSAPAY